MQFKMTQVKSFADDPVKRIWRKELVEFSREFFSQNQLRNFRYMCLPGSQMIEIFEVCDPLGIKRKNVFGFEKRGFEFSELSKLNSSLESPIKVYHQNIYDFLRLNPGIKFDFVSIDDTGYFNTEKENIIRQLCLGNNLAENSILVTNFCKGRENAKTKARFQRRLLFDQNPDIVFGDLDEYVEWYKKNDLFSTDSLNPELEIDMEKLRDRDMQLTIYNSLNIGTGYWNNRFTREYIERIRMSNEAREELNQGFKDFNNHLNTNSEPALWRRLLEGWLHVFGTQSPRMDVFFAYLTMDNINRKFVSEHKAYEYVGDGGTKMLSDLYYIKTNRFIAPNDLANSFSIDIRGHRTNIHILNKSKFEQLLDSLVDYYAEIVQYMKNTDQLPKKRELLILKGNNYDGNSGITLDSRINAATKERQKSVAPENKLGDTKILIYTDIKLGISDADIMNRYGLSKMELAGHKAQITRRQKVNGDSSLESRAGNKNGKISAEFDPEDLELIDLYIADNVKSTVIAGYFEGIYTWQAIAARKIQLYADKNGSAGKNGKSKIKRQILERDNYQCRNCNTTLDEHLVSDGTSLHVHHIDYNDQNNDPTNMITLCSRCHGMTNTIQQGPGLRIKLEGIITNIYTSTALEQSN